VRFFTRFAWLGLISYALYATARPIQIGIFRVAQSLPASAASFMLCAATTVAVAFVVAWYLERRLQPAIGRVFR
jgi:peptidoglycan/LPS O-acetylase OafA/YrhL